MSDELFGDNEYGPEEILSEVMLTRAQKGTTFIFVEGDDDARFLELFVDDNSCEVKALRGRENILKASEIILDEKFQGVLCVADSDFGGYFGLKIPKVKHLYFLEYRDLEDLLLSSNSFEKLLKIKAHSPKLKKFREDHGSISDWLRRIAFPIGLLVSCSLEKKWNLDFTVRDKGGNPQKGGFIQKVLKKNLKDGIDVQAMIALLMARSSNKLVGLKCGEIEKEFNERKKLNIEDMRWFSRGEDLLGLLVTALQGTIGKQTKSYVAGNLLDDLLLAFEVSDFENTGLKKYIEDWERRNGFICLKR